ncbi:cyclopropane-fatty-acyl-phospholipid synthase [Heliocybe sulcata]|uniref:Cyclopropane-fatty-acyl-phospholipid synthase n=1 Tax=Heliocybe sulcata TaxID=5364 RepID=A0A5C3N8D1_9AGAM|nr:cyclopropane-fatty-acyl-phospholipid synthase [Heliocybe sulcata]
MTSAGEYIAHCSNYLPGSGSSNAQALLNNLSSHVQSLLGRPSLGAIQPFAKSAIISTLSRITRGQLHVESLGVQHDFGSAYTLPEHVAGPSGALTAHIKVLDEAFWVRLLLNTDLGFADAYMLGEIEVDNLSNIFKIFLLNRRSLRELSMFLTPLVRTFSYLSNTRLTNALTRSRQNISMHYDLSNEVFEAFLSRDMTYSCAVFTDELGGSTGDLLETKHSAPHREPMDEGKACAPDDLEKGQLEKLHLLARKARIKKGSRVLEIGCGWGSFSILAATEYGATVEAITLSTEQQSVVQRKIDEMGLSHRITVRLMDYRELPEEFHHAFDAVVSIGVMEHVGIEYMRDWFKVMDWAMKEENAVKVCTMTTIPDTKWASYSRDVDFIRKYIFPGGQLSSIKSLVDAATDAGLNIHSVEDIGPHYARTLREWNYRFQRNFDSRISPALRRRYPHLTEADIQVFQRKWTYYFMYCEAGFAMRFLSDNVIVFTREGNLLLD